MSEFDKPFDRYPVLREHFRVFARTARWGTCVDCPRTIADQEPFPEWCKFTERYDHNLTLDELVELYKRS